MTSKKRPIRKKLKSHTPIVFKVSKELQDSIKLPPRKSLDRFRASCADATDWFNIAFRVRVGVQLAIAEYDRETMKDLTDAFTFCDTLCTRAKKDNGPDWTLTPSEINYIDGVLDWVDIMQDQTTRRAQLDAHHVAQKLMRVYVKSFDDYLAKVASCIPEPSV